MKNFKKIISLMLVITMTIPALFSTASATALVDITEECMKLNKILDVGIWINKGGEPVCGCKTCKVLYADYRYLQEVLDELNFAKFSKEKLEKEYKLEIGKDIAKAVGHYTISVALVSDDILRKSGLSKLVSANSKIGGSFNPIRIIFGGVAILSGGVWYTLKISSDHARDLIEMTKRMLNRLNMYIEEGDWKDNNYLMLSYDTKDATNHVHFKKHEDIYYTEAQKETFSNKFKTFRENVAGTLKEIKDLESYYKKELEMVRNNKWYKHLTRTVPLTLLSTTFAKTAIGKLIDSLSQSERPTLKEFKSQLKQDAIGTELSYDDQNKIIETLGSTYKNILNTGKSSPDYIQTAQLELKQIQSHIMS